ncbi:ABC transporter substrate-binding protein [Streptomyces sp. NBC_01754]|uniref:ABC transporter substrate-binding protein n=1 Tax=Streptomyces sp. NBC_01754 TaxID=2975930 RepID=UPI002DD80C6C|nr:ABC transporter substrate-binding protein [Streptomyces sp. NBC_01754]WSC91420.1 ABC transporter substrate-binding protein [Streptomyces sp. NBC_01754]
METEQSGTTGFDAAVDGVVAPTDTLGGTLRLVRTDDFDSLDPGNTYYAYTWNFLRLIGRTLVTFDAAPGKAGQRLVPDLAESLGEASDGGRTWTYRLRPGLRYEDGTPVVSADVKYAIARSNYGTDVLGVGPTYFRHLLGTDYGGPWREPDVDGPITVETPDDRTLVLRLAEPFAGMDLLATMPSTTPVPRARDTGIGYRLGPVATGPYRVASYERGRLVTLERNPHWDPATDPVRRRRAERIEVHLGKDPHEVDLMLLSGEAHIDLAGFGVQPAAQERILADPGLRAHADNPLTGFTWIYCLSSRVAPFDNVHCRRAVQFATDKLAMQEAYGGPVGGDIATTILPPTIDGYQPFDRYPVGETGTGDLEAARAELALAGMPDGFRTKIAARKDRLKEYRAAEALSAGLARVGIEAEVLDFPSGDYFDRYGGSPEYLHEHGIGIIMFGWGADFPDGYGFFQQIVDGRAIKERGNQNMGELDDPEINALLDRGAVSDDPAERAAIWHRIDRLTMDHAVIVPYLYPRSLLYRHPDARNVFVTGSFGMYDYVALGAR